MRLPVCCCLLLLVAATRGQDDGGFDLADAFGTDELTPTSKPKPGPADDTLGDLDVLGFGDTGGASNVPTKPPAKPPAAGGADDDDGFNLEDAVGGGDDAHKPTVKPQPGGGGGGGGGSFGDHDLGDPGMDHNNPGGHDNSQKGRAFQPSSGEEEPAQEVAGNQSMLAGIVSTVAVAAVGAVSSFIAYQKKKLCFKGAATDDPENVNMDGHKGDQSEPQVQSSLLAK